MSEIKTGTIKGVYILNDFQKKTLDEVVVSVDYEKKGFKTTIAFVTCKNGYEVVGTSGCVNPKDFDFEIGKHYALVDALTQLGKLEGYHRHQNNFWVAKISEKGFQIPVLNEIDVKEVSEKMAEEIAKGLKRQYRE